LPKTRLPAQNAPIAHLLRWVCFLCLGLLPGLARADVLVFGAASTTTAVSTLIGRYGEAGTVHASFAASSALARQIQAGAPADIFMSANEQWMDAISGLLVPGTRRDLLANRLVLIAPASETCSDVQDLTADYPLLARLGDGRLAIADPDHVPAGQYARSALEHLGLWRAIRARLAPAGNVRMALALVERGEAPLGIVYETDSRITDRVRVVAVVAPALHAPIRYPAAIIAGHDRREVRAFYDYLFSGAAAKVFAEAGFRRP